MEEAVECYINENFMSQGIILIPANHSLFSPQ
jgi:hypothetical protein